ncbi:glutathione S-transferase family protein [Algihabitans albus]|uniref:glutathione S-transferase family protein n=1 Tax=Algihabitans albus TaxID=2164067 RepID=UPI000E5D350B|nr:glutathione S-transferase family protein [Algihabitans albus]
MVRRAAKILQLYNHPLSFMCQIVRLCLVEKGLSWRRTTVDIGPGLEAFDPWFVKLNPAMELPVLCDRERVVTGTEAICRYLDGAFDGPLLDHRGEAQAWIDLVDRLPVALLTAARFPRLALRHLRRQFHRLEDRAAVNPDLAGLYNAKAIEIDRLARDLSSPDRIVAVERQLEVTLDRAEAALAHRPFLTGEHFTLADVFWAVLLARLALLGHGRLWAEGRRPGLAAYWARLQVRPSLTQAGVRSRLSPRDIAWIALRSRWSGFLRLVFASALAVAGVLLWKAYA